MEVIGMTDLYMAASMGFKDSDTLLLFWFFLVFIKGLKNVKNGIPHIRHQYNYCPKKLRVLEWSFISQKCPILNSY